MIAIELQKIEVDHCVACGGVWFDGGELELLFGSVDQKNRLVTSFEKDFQAREAKRKCPICLKKMEKVFYGKNRKILLDNCCFKDGIWFDKGELEKVIQLSEFNGGGEVIKLLQDIFVEQT